MKRNMFGEPRPANSEEIGQALDELLIDPDLASVIVDEDNGEYFAEIIGENDTSFQAGPFADRHSLDVALGENGLEDFD